MIRFRKILKPNLTKVILNPQLGQNAQVKKTEGCIECEKKNAQLQESAKNIQKIQQNKFDLLKSKNVHTNNYVEKIWKNETVYLIGGGPSLINFNWEKLRGKKTIAINKSALYYPHADIMYWTDSRFYSWYKNDIDKLTCKKYTLRSGKKLADDIISLNRGETFGLSEYNNTLCHGNNSGYAAINLAYHLGAKTIVLLGYDMKANDNSHFHDGYPIPPTTEAVYREHFLPGFKILAERLKAKDINVFNASEFSEIDVWEKISFDHEIFSDSF
jgi:hypothetical protein